MQPATTFFRICGLPEAAVEAVRAQYPQDGLCFKTLVAKARAEGRWTLPRPHIVTCHLHTNDRVLDRHWLPNDPRGKTDWAAEMPVLLSAPRLKQLHNEATPSAENPFTVREQVESLNAIAALG